MTGYPGVIASRDPDTEQPLDLDLDPDIRALKVVGYVWNTSTLQWERMVQPSIELSGGDLTVTMGDVEKLLSGTYWLDTRYGYDGDGNCIYKGTHTTLGVAEGDGNWRITKYDYTAGNCVRKRVRITSWTLRAVGW